MDDPFPPYRYLPGKAPHPFAHEGGWGHGQQRPVPPWVPPECWGECRAFLFGCDLFNQGWWWEAHETWEELWHVAQPHGTAWTELLKGLIQLAACALNRERGVHSGADRLLRSAQEALERAATVAGARRVCGLDLDALAEAARRHLLGHEPPRPGLHLLPLDAPLD